MSQLVAISTPALPALVAAAGERASMRFLEFFAANIRNPHTRRAYGIAPCLGQRVALQDKILIYGRNPA